MYCMCMGSILPGYGDVIPHHTLANHSPYRENLDSTTKNARTITFPPPDSWLVEKCRIFNFNCS